MPDREYRPRDLDLVLPLQPPVEFLDWLTGRYRLKPRQLDLIRCRTGQLTFKETARELGLKLGYVQRLQATLLSQVNHLGGHTALMLWIAQEYQLWRQREREREREKGVDHRGDS